MTLPVESIDLAFIRGCISGGNRLLLVSLELRAPTITHGDLLQLEAPRVVCVPTPEGPLFPWLLPFLPPPSPGGGQGAEGLGGHYSLA